MPDRVRLMLVFGGRSAEHDVSRATAVAVARALDPARYEVIPVAITQDGRWLAADAARAFLASASAPGAASEGAERSATAVGLPVTGKELVSLGAAVASPGRDALRADVVFPVLHGPYGEDGTVQGLLELADVAYVGSGVIGSAVAMDKVMSKRAFAACGLATPAWRALRDGQDRNAFVRRVEDELGYPCFVKPANMGSSVGVTKAHDRAELEAALDEAFRFDEWLLAEEAVTGREIEVAVLGDDPPEASVPGEIRPGAEFYSYKDKYEDGAAELLVPAPLDPGSSQHVRDLACRAFEACRCEAMARVDFFYEEAGRGFLVNELNTIPGFTPISMFPRLWDASGLPYPALLDRLVESAFARHDRRARRARRARRG